VNSKGSTFRRRDAKPGTPACGHTSVHEEKRGETKYKSWGRLCCCRQHSSRFFIVVWELIPHSDHKRIRLGPPGAAAARLSATTSLAAMATFAGTATFAAKAVLAGTATFAATAILAGTATFAATAILAGTATFAATAILAGTAIPAAKGTLAGTGTLTGTATLAAMRWLAAMGRLLAAVTLAATRRLAATGRPSPGKRESPTSEVSPSLRSFSLLFPVDAVRSHIVVAIDLLPLSSARIPWSFVSPAAPRRLSAGQSPVAKPWPVPRIAYASPFPAVAPPSGLACGIASFVARLERRDILFGVSLEFAT